MVVWEADGECLGRLRVGQRGCVGRRIQDMSGGIPEIVQRQTARANSVTVAVVHGLPVELAVKVERA